MDIITDTTSVIYFNTERRPFSTRKRSNINRNLFR